MIQWFIRDGRLTLLAELLLGAIVLFGAFGIPLLNLPSWLAIPIGLMSVVAAGVLMFEGRATALGLKPFTNDPSGWRKAKKTYTSETDANTSEDVRKDSKP